MEKQGVGLRVEGVAEMVLAAEADEQRFFHLSERVRELEAENVRLKSLIGELLVTNQQLREAKSQGAEIRQ